jgi:imidazolonepropionase-like amidohydrolase
MRAFFLLAMALSWQATLALAAASDNSFAVRNVRVFDGEKTIAKANVIVRDGMIIVVGTVPIPNSIKVIDGSNKTLL